MRQTILSRAGKVLDYFYPPKKLSNSVHEIVEKHKFSVASLGVVLCIAYYLNEKLRPHYRRRQALHSLLNAKLSIPEIYPIYVEQKAFCDNIKKGLIRDDGGIRLIWAPPGSGKSTYLSQALGNSNFLVIHTIPNSLSQYPTDGNCGTWLGKALGVGTALFEARESFPTMINNTLYNRDRIIKLFYRIIFRVWWKPEYLELNEKHPIVLCMDQFDNAFSTTNGELLTIYLKKLAEESVRDCRFIVVVAVKSPKVAKQIRNVNSGVKVSHIGKATTHKWTEKEIELFFDRASKYYNMESLNYSKLSKNYKVIAVNAGTPQQCKAICDSIRLDIEMDVNSTDQWDHGWQIANMLDVIS